MNGRFSVMPGKDVTIKNLGYYQIKPTSSKLFQTQTSIQRLSLLFVSINLGGAIVQWVEHWTCDQQVTGSNPTLGIAA